MQSDEPGHWKSEPLQAGAGGGGGSGCRVGAGARTIAETVSARDKIVSDNLNHFEDFNGCPIISKSTLTAALAVILI